MSVYFGNTKIGSLYLGSTKIGAAYLGNVKVYESSQVDPLNPLGLPPYTIRVQYEQGHTPTTSKGSLSLVDAQSNTWDLTYENTSWGSLFANKRQLLSVLGANASGVTDMSYMFAYCSVLTSIPTFNTSSVTSMRYMMSSSALINIPKFNTSSVTNVNSMCSGCKNVESGALDLYQQMVNQATPPSSHTGCFQYCGSETTTGQAELAQIPTSWGGTMS